MLKRLTLAALAAASVALAGAAPAEATPGDPYFNACNSHAVLLGCTQDVLGSATSVEVSPDGRHVYLATYQPVTGIQLYDRAPTGALTRRGGSDGCVTAAGPPCATGTNMMLAWDIAISPDGRSLYYAGDGDRLLVFDRDPDTGVLGQKAGFDGCIGSPPGCTPRIGNPSVFGVVVSSDNRSVYVRTFSGLLVFDRDPDTGTLAQKAGVAGCLDENAMPGCLDTFGLSFGSDVNQIAVSPNGRQLYVPFTDPGGITVFNRASNGTLAQSACISANVTPGCTSGSSALLQSRVAAVDPTGTSVYVGGLAGVAVFRRSDATGLLTQVQCLHESGQFGCTDVVGVEATVDIAPAPDGGGVLLGGLGGTLAFFRRDGAGALTQHPGRKGCMNGDGADGCEQVFGLDSSTRVAIAPNGLDAYAASFLNGFLLSLERDFPPVCQSTSVTLAPDAPQAIPLSCTDANLDAITYQVAGHPTSGELGSLAPGSIVYDPFAGFAGQDSFTYQGVGRGIASAPASVLVNVNAIAGAVDPDADGDGFPASRDCRDNQRRIRPNAREVVGNGVDENCDGRAVPGQIRSVVRSHWRSFVDYTDVTELRVRGVPRRARGQVRCLGKGCRFKSRDVRARKRTIDFLTALKGSLRRFDAGQTIEVRVTARFHVGKVVRYKVRPRAVPDGKTLCLPVGKTKPRRRC